MIAKRKPRKEYAEKRCNVEEGGEKWDEAVGEWLLSCMYIDYAEDEQKSSKIKAQKEPSITQKKSNAEGNKGRFWHSRKSEIKYFSFHNHSAVLTL